MIAFPNCKINIGLHILRKRPDNYHDIETIFYPVGLCDVLEILPSKKSEISFNTTGISIDNSSGNLCVKAYQLIKNDFPYLPAVSIHLHKVIPVGAGLGGGSSDAIATLQLLIKIFSLEISAEQLLVYALMLGSDCPFFLLNKPALATGRGEILSPLEALLKGYHIVIAFPHIHCNTAKAFSSVKPYLSNESLKILYNKPVNVWSNSVINDFEESVFIEHPAIQNIKQLFYNAGAEYASLSGSGSSVYGLFKKEVPVFNLPEEYFVYKTKLQ
jgi:4-diphosphocytidyl-2-C-methyl-D-erythritol kinase